MHLMLVLSTDGKSIERMKLHKWTSASSQLLSTHQGDSSVEFMPSRVQSKDRTQLSLITMTLLEGRGADIYTENKS